MHTYDDAGQITHCGCRLCGDVQAENQRLRSALEQFAVYHAGVLYGDYAQAQMADEIRTKARAALDVRQPGVQAR